MKQISILFILLILGCVVSVDENKFKKCNQAGFCARHRSKPTKLQYTIDPSSVKVEENHLSALLLPSVHQTTDLEMIIRILPNDLIRVHIAEVNPLNGRQRFEATDVLIPEFIKEQPLVVVSQDESKVVVESSNKKSRLEITFAPLHIAYYVNGVLKITINDKNLFYIEVTRTKADSTISNETAEKKDEVKEKKIVDYTEAGHAL